MFDSHELTIRNKTVIGLVAQAGAVLRDVRALGRNVDKRGAVGVLPVDINLLEVKVSLSNNMNTFEHYCENANNCLKKSPESNNKTLSR